MITPVDLLDLARELSRRTTERCWRAAVSRAYYSAFHAARNLLDGLRFRVPRADQAHHYLYLRLSNSGDPATESAGQDLGKLRTERNHADYDIHLNRRQLWAFTQVQVAERILRVLEAASLPPLRDAITRAMRDYERNVLKDVTYTGP